MKQPPPVTPEFNYASFIIRAGALVVDFLILGVIFSFLGLVLRITMSFNLRMDNFLSDDLELIATPFFTVSFFIYSGLKMAAFWLFYALFESRVGGTPGKLIFRMRVTGIDGRQISFQKATGHAFARLLSFLPFFTGYLMAAFTDKTQALHDILSGCIVIPERQVVTTPIENESKAPEPV